MRDERSTGAAIRTAALSTGARHYALGVLVVVYTFNFIDRNILAVLLPSIKADLGLSDSSLGFLVGVAFALFYATLGLPIALFADRANRRNLIAVSLAVWSVMTALCGLAQNFTQLALARIGVGIGEAGCSPPAHSLLSDFYPPERRATALSVYSLGIPLGIMFGLFVGGWVDQLYGWRNALFIVGLPGLMLALMVRFTIVEPERGLSENRRAATDRPSIAATLKFLLARPAFVHLAFGAGLAAFAGYSIASWFPSFLSRSLAMEQGEIGSWVGLILGIPGGIGIFLGGYLADRCGEHDARWRLWVVVVAFLIAAPLWFVTFLSTSRAIVLMAFSLPVLLTNFYQATCFAQTQNLVDLRMRSVAAAVLLFIINIVGLGAGPWSTGYVSELLTPRYGPEALRYALLVASVFYVWSAVHMYLAGRYLPRDLARSGLAQ